MAPSKKDKTKSNHLKELEAVFEKTTRRFSAFDILGLNDNQKQHETDTPVSQADTPVSETGKSDLLQNTTDVPEDRPDVSQNSSVVVGSLKEDLTTSTSQTDTPVFSEDRSVSGSFRGVSETDTPISQTDIFKLNQQEQLAAYEFRSKLTDKHRSVLSTLNILRSLEQPMYTVPVGYGTLSRRAGLHENYLRLTVIPRLAMLGLIGIARRSMQGTTYHLYYNDTFIRVICSEHQVNAIEALPLPELDAPEGAALTLPSWVNRERWGDLAPETFQQLQERAGSEAQAKEVLDIIVHNETHGPQGQRVRNRRAVLAHYLKNPNAEIWPNEGYETLVVRQAREKRDQEMELQRLEEEALAAREKTARLRFINALSDKQLAWLKQEARRRVDAEPGSRMLENQFPLYKAEEERLIEEWRERSGFGEEIPEAH